VSQTAHRLQALELAHIGVRAFIDRAATGGLHQAGDDRIPPLVGTGAGELDHHHRAETVGDHAGQAVGLSVDQAHPVLARQPGMRCPPRPRGGHRPLDEGVIDGLLHVEGPHPGADLRLRRPRRPRQGSATGILHQHRIPRPRPPLQPIHRAGKDPGVTTEHGTFLAGFENQISHNENAR